MRIFKHPGPSCKFDPEEFLRTPTRWEQFQWWWEYRFVRKVKARATYYFQKPRCLCGIRLNFEEIEHLGECEGCFNAYMSDPEGRVKNG